MASGKITNNLGQGAKAARERSQKIKAFLLGGIALAVIAVIFMFNFTNVGKAIQIETPQDIIEAVDLDVEEFVEANVANIASWEMSVISSSGEARELTMELTSLGGEEGVVEYILQDKEAVVQQGLLEEGLIQYVYLDFDDALADIALSYDAGYYKILNLNFVPGDAATFSVSVGEEELVGDLIPTSTEQETSMMFTATSTKTPSIEFMWDDGTLFDGTVELAQETENSQTWGVVYTAVNEDPRLLVVTASVGDVITTKYYTLVAGGVVFIRDTPELPGLVIKETTDGLAGEFTLRETLEKQPFALPCGEFDPHTRFGDAVTLFTYDGDVAQWKKGVPSSLSTIESGEGYLAQFSELPLDDEEFTFDFSCENDFSLAELECNDFSLLDGWNLVGICGYNPKSVESVIGKALAVNTDVETIYSITNEGSQEEVELAEFEPGRAYWVKVS